VTENVKIAKNVELKDFLTEYNGRTITAVAKDGTSQASSGGSSATTYTITVNAAENGTVRANRGNASSGTTITVTATANDGYEVNDVTVVDASGNSVTVKAAGNGSYTFAMPASNVTVTATFKEASVTATPVAGFSDVSSSDYFADAVAWAVENGITSGTSDNTFSPNASCTRAEMMTFLWRAAGSPTASGSVTFSDVSSDAYYAQAIAWAVENGITSGTGDGKFSPNATVTRAESVQFLYRAAGSPAASGSSFSDVAANAYYANAVAWAVANGITSGTGNNTFSPNANCVRAQIVTFLYKNYNK
jgi:hypothetical protein